MKLLLVAALLAVLIIGAFAGRDAIRSMRQSVATQTRRID